MEGLEDNKVYYFKTKDAFAAHFSDILMREIEYFKENVLEDEDEIAEFDAVFENGTTTPETMLKSFMQASSLIMAVDEDEKMTISLERIPYYA
jgi:hypothetical protein